MSFKSLKVARSFNRNKKAVRQLTHRKIIEKY